MALSDVIANPNIKPVFIAELTAGVWFKNWVATSGRSITYDVSTALSISSVEEDGTALTERASVGDVDSNAGSWFHDTAAGTLYVSATTGTPYGKTIQAFADFNFSSRGKVLNNLYYDPRIKDVPSVTMRIEPRFSDVGQTGGGQMVLANEDGYFDNLDGLQWDAGDVVIKFGADRGASVMDYADYENFGTYRALDWSLDDESFTINLGELKANIDRDIPFEVFDRSTYPTIDESFLGEVIPRAYGVIFGAEPIIIDVGLKKFKVANHAIFDFVDVRVEDEDGILQQSAFASVDKANGQFTLGDDWETGRAVAVDFVGRVRSDGKPMINPSDVVKDLLEYAGETSRLNTPSFTAAYNALDVGEDRYKQRTTARKMGIYIREAKNLLDLISEINTHAGSYLYVNQSGQYTFGVWTPSVGEGLQVFDQSEQLAWTSETFNSEIPSKVVVQYARRDVDEFWQSLSVERDEFQYAHDQPAARVKEVETFFYDTADARAFAQSVLNMEGRPLKLHRVTLPWKGFTLFPGDQIRLTDTRRAVDLVVEVLEINVSLLEGAANLVCGDMRGLSSEPGFWVADAATLPSHLSTETGYGAGALTWNASWSDAIKTWAKQNVGYWTDANGFATTTDAGSHMGSTWI